MKRFLQVLRPIVAVVCVIGAWGCSDDDTPDNPTNETTFEIVNKTVSVAAEGGSAASKYTVTNPIADAAVQAATTAEWISDFEAKGETLSFTVTANPNETERRADVAVTYADLKGSFSVVQAAKGGEIPINEAFEITIVELEALSVVASVLPKDKEMTYLFGGISMEDLNSFPDDLTFVNDYLIPVHKVEAEKAGLSVEELMDMALLFGDQASLPIGNFTAETEYCVFCVGMNNKLEILSDFEKIIFTTPALPEFDAELSVEIEGATASVLCSPANSEDGWFSALYKGKGHKMEDLQYSAQGTVEAMILQNMQWGTDRAGAVKNMTKHGVKIESFNLDAESDYTVIVFTINPIGYVSSKPVVEEFTTGRPVLSQNEITFEYTKVDDRKVEFIVWASVDEDPYTFFTYRNTDEWKAMTDDEIIQRICEIEAERLPNYIRHGDVSSWENGLRADTEYVTYAFGYEGGVITTPLFKGPVTTLKAEKNSSTFVYEYGPYYNGDEAAAKYPAHLASAAGKVVFPTAYKVTGEWQGIWHALYVGDLTDKAQYPDEDVYMALRTGNNWISSAPLYKAAYDQVLTLCGYVETADGKFGEIYRQLVGPFTKEGCAPINEFVVPDFETAAVTSSVPKLSNIFNFEELTHPITGNGFKPAKKAATTMLNAEKSKVLNVQKLQYEAKPSGIVLHTVKR